MKNGPIDKILQILLGLYIRKPREKSLTPPKNGTPQNGVILAIMGVSKMALRVPESKFRTTFQYKLAPKTPKRHLRNPTRPKKSDF